MSHLETLLQLLDIQIQPVFKKVNNYKICSVLSSSTSTESTKMLMHADLTRYGDIVDKGKVDKLNKHISVICSTLNTFGYFLATRLG